MRFLVGLSRLLIVSVFIFLLLVPSDLLSKSEGAISGRIVDKKTDDPVISAKVVLFKSTDSTLLNGTFTNAKGEFRFSDIPFGRYYLTVSYVGYGSLKTQPFSLNSKINFLKMNDLFIEQGSILTNEIEVTAEKQTVEYSMDKKVINVEKNITSAGGSAVDVLSNIPSITVDYDGNVSLRGSTNLTILIDGKPSQVLGSNRNAVLEQIPASSIESVEIISNPSAKYNPEGMNGVLNIVLKKQTLEGLNGITTLSVGTRDKYSGSFNGNYGFSDFSIFGAYDIRSDRRAGQGSSLRTTFVSDSASYIQQAFSMNRKGFDNTVKLGTDIYFSHKSSLTLTGNYSFDTDNHTRVIDNNSTNFLNQPTDVFKSTSAEDNDDNSLNLALNYKLKFDKKDHALTADINFSNGKSTEGEAVTQDYKYFNSLPAPNYLVLQNTVNSDKSTNANIELNYSHPFDKDSRYEIGYQGIIRKLDNDAFYETFNDSLKLWLEDKMLSNRFLYNENIHAFYGTFANYYGLFRYQLGLRLEQAWTNSEQVTQLLKNEHNYFSWFPSAHLSFKLDNTQDLQLSYSRRINRPGVWSLNPFKDISNPLDVRYGNPYLKPEYINSYELAHNKNWESTSLISTLFYRQINDVIKRYTFIDSLGVANSTSMNLSSGTSYGVEFILEQTFFKWWRANANFSYYRTLIKGSADGLDLTNDNYSWNAKLNTSITPEKSMNFQLNAAYRAPQVTPQGEQKASWNVDIAAKYTFFKDILTLGCRVSDIFNTSTFDFITRGPGFVIDGSRKRETRVAYLTLSIKLNSGIKQKEGRRGGNGMDDEGGGGMD